MTWNPAFAGSVNIQVTANGCNGPSIQTLRTVVITPTVGIPTPIVVSLGVEPTCQVTNGTTQTTYSTTATNSTGFNWSINPITAGTIDPLTGVMTWNPAFAGSVNIQVTANGCNGPSIQTLWTVVITPTVGIPTPIVVSLGVEPTCQVTNGTTQTTYSTTATNSTGFNWSINPITAGTIDPLTGVMTWNPAFAGSVNIQVTANGCNGPSIQTLRTVVITPTVGIPTPIVVSLGVEPTCQVTNGTTQTTYSTTATNSTGFNWSINPITAGTIDPLTGVMTWNPAFAGSVNIQVTANGCNGPSIQTLRTVVITPTVGIPTPIVVSLGVEPTCQVTNGTTQTTYSTTATNSTGFNWSINPITAGTIDPLTGVMTWNPAFAGSVNIQVTANGCNGPSIQTLRTVVITPTVGIPTPIVVSLGVEPTCQVTNGTTQTTYSTTATNSTGFNWSINPITAGTIDPLTGVMTWNPAFAGSVNIQVTANGCNGPSIQTLRTVIINILPFQPEFISPNNLNSINVCSDIYGVYFSVNHDQTVNYTWSSSTQGIPYLLASDVLNYGNNCVFFFHSGPLNANGLYDVIVTATDEITGCSNSNIFNVQLDNDNVIDTAKILLINQADKILAIFNNDVDVTGFDHHAYQWGCYDIITLEPIIFDSDTGHFQIFKAGEQFASENKYWWVNARKGNCESKSFYHSKYLPYHYTKLSEVNSATPPPLVSPIVSSIYPNPNIGSFTIRVDGFEETSVTLTIRDVLGNELFANEVDGNELISGISIQTSLARGVYFLSLDDRKGKLVANKFIVQ
ncbi:MAG: T9SS type A sorting domain-containing protein [Chitinophagaceae bacterium]|nr:T9SS type A sorting domain-containing protein [Chitinophagaceae bacterium]